MKLPNNQQKLVDRALHAAGFLAVALVLTTFYQLGYARLVDQGEDYVNRAKQLDQLLATSETAKQRHQSLRQELDDLEQQAATMRQRLPHDLQKEQFESSVRKAASQAGLQFEQATWNTPNSISSHSLAEVSISGTGSFAGICRFLDEINQLTRITKISRLQLASDSESQHYPFQVTFVLVYGIQSNDTKRKDGVL